MEEASCGTLSGCVLAEGASFEGGCWLWVLAGSRVHTPYLPTNNQARLQPPDRRNSAQRQNRLWHPAFTGCRTSRKTWNVLPPTGNRATSFARQCPPARCRCGEPAPARRRTWRCPGRRWSCRPGSGSGEGFSRNRAVPSAAIDWIVRRHDADLGHCFADVGDGQPGPIQPNASRRKRVWNAQAVVVARCPSPWRSGDAEE